MRRSIAFIKQFDKQSNREHSTMVPQNGQLAFQSNALERQDISHEHEDSFGLSQETFLHGQRPLDRTHMAEQVFFQNTFSELQKWEGRVVHIATNEFLARLIDVTARHTHETVEATIPISNVSKDDRASIRVGSKFSWAIGYERSREGTQKRVSKILFWPSPKVTKSDLQKAEAWAQRIFSFFNS